MLSRQTCPTYACPLGLRPRSARELPATLGARGRRHDVDGVELGALLDAARLSVRSVKKLGLGHEPEAYPTPPEIKLCIDGKIWTHFREALNIQVYVSDFPLYLLIYKQFPGYLIHRHGHEIKE